MSRYSQNLYGFQMLRDSTGHGTKRDILIGVPGTNRDTTLKGCPDVPFPGVVNGGTHA